MTLKKKTSTKKKKDEIPILNKKKEVDQNINEDDEESELSFSEASETTHDSAVESSDLSSSVTDDMIGPGGVGVGVGGGDGVSGGVGVGVGGGSLQLTLDPNTVTTMQKKIAANAKKLKDIQLSDPRGSIYIGHLPWGFFESQIRKFFSQFGVVTGVNMPKSKKTGNFKHYAFVEFLDPIVAKIAAETMDGYIMFSRTLDVRYIPPEQSKTWLFRKHKTPRPLDKTVFLKNTNKERTKEEIKKRHHKLIKKEKITRKKLMDAGIDCWDFPGFEEEKKKKKTSVKVPTEESSHTTSDTSNHTETTTTTQMTKVKDTKSFRESL